MQDSDEPEKGLGLPLWITWVAVVLALLAIGVYIYGIRLDSTAKIGTFGDFVGGTLNPVFAFISFLALLYTINIQLKELALSRQELRLTREELSKSADALQSQNETSKRQRFENTLFSMIGVLNQIVVDMDIGGLNNTKSGRDCFNVFFTQLEALYSQRGYHISMGDSPALIEKRKQHSKSRLNTAYDKFYLSTHTELGHYFRVLFNIFRYIDRNEIEEDIYHKLFRAQFSDQELLIIFYNTLSQQGRPLMEYAKKFALFDNLNTEALFRKEHMDLMDPEAFAANPRLLPREDAGHTWIDD
jgi:Putative phage abortive infection protein